MFESLLFLKSPQANAKVANNESGLVLINTLQRSYLVQNLTAPPGQHILGSSVYVICHHGKSYLKFHGISPLSGIQNCHYTLSSVVRV